MDILFLEDRGSISIYTAEALQIAGHSVWEAFSVLDARSLFDEKHDQIDCIIADLNMDPDGLKPEEISETHDGILTGWIWLTHYVYPRRPALQQRTLLFSDYLADFKKHVPAKEYEGVRLVPKRSTSGPYTELMKQVSAVSRALESSRGR